MTLTPNTPAENIAGWINVAYFQNDFELDLSAVSLSHRLMPYAAEMWPLLTKFHGHIRPLEFPPEDFDIAVLFLDPYGRRHAHIVCTMRWHNDPLDLATRPGMGYITGRTWSSLINEWHTDGDRTRSKWEELGR